MEEARLLVVMPNGKIDVTASDARLADRPAVYRGGTAKPAVGISKPIPMDSPTDNPATWSTAEAIRHKEIAQARLRQIEADLADHL